jgi:hypothetical protein
MMKRDPAVRIPWTSTVKVNIRNNQCKHHENSPGYDVISWYSYKPYVVVLFLSRLSEV